MRLLLRGRQRRHRTPPTTPTRPAARITVALGFTWTNAGEKRARMRRSTGRCRATSVRNRSTAIRRAQRAGTGDRGDREENVAAALHASKGRTVWQQSLGPPAMSAALPPARSTRSQYRHAGDRRAPRRALPRRHGDVTAMPHLVFGLSLADGGRCRAGRWTCSTHAPPA